MKLTGMSVSELLAAFRAPEPTPGGGSAAALAGAIGASLLAMVAGLAKPAAPGEAALETLRDAGSRCTNLARLLEALIEQDAAAYDLVVGAYRMPKETEQDKAARSSGIQTALRAATEAPLEVMRRCGEGLQLAQLVGALGNPNAASDVKVARAMLKAGLDGAAENVEVNLGSIKDATYVERVRGEVSALVNAAWAS